LHERAKREIAADVGITQPKRRLGGSARPERDDVRARILRLFEEHGLSLARPAGEPGDVDVDVQAPRLADASARRGGHHRRRLTPTPLLRVNSIPAASSAARISSKVRTLNRRGAVDTLGAVNRARRHARAPRQLVGTDPEQGAGRADLCAGWHLSLFLRFLPVFRERVGEVWGTDPLDRFVLLGHSYGGNHRQAADRRGEPPNSIRWPGRSPLLARFTGSARSSSAG
jgi:hypothetical protein